MAALTRTRCARPDADQHRRRALPQVQVLVDGSDPNTASLIMGYAQGVVASWSGLRAAESGPPPPAVVQQRFWFNPALTSRFFLVPSLGQGLLISAGTKNQFLASQLALLSGFLPAFLLSGFLFEIGSMPRVIQWLSAIVPARYLIPSLQTVFLAGDLWPFFLRNIAVLLLYGGVFLALAARTTRKRI